MSAPGVRSRESREIVSRFGKVFEEASGGRVDVASGASSEGDDVVVAASWINLSVDEDACRAEMAIAGTAKLDMRHCVVLSDGSGRWIGRDARGSDLDES